VKSAAQGSVKLISIKIDPGSIHIDDDAWEFVSADEDWITHKAVLERHADGSVAEVYRRQPRGLAALLEANKARLDESETNKTRFGDGKTVASIPLNVLFDPKIQLAEKIREGDIDHLKWWLNREDARPWRNFRGRV
jgi:hypothetical protein